MKYAQRHPVDSTEQVGTVDKREIQVRKAGIESGHSDQNAASDLCCDTQH